MAQYSIKDLEKLSGIKAHTIRIWEQRYNILEPQRTKTNIRYYQDKDLKVLLNVALLNKNGLKIGKIAEMSENEIAQQVSHLTEIKDLESNQFDAMAIAMMEMDELKFEIIFSRAIKQYSFEHVMLEVIFPFLERASMLWLSGSIEPVQEMFIINLIRQKLIVAIDSIKVPDKPINKKFAVFTPPGERQELSILLMWFLLKSRGFDVLYLGQDVGLGDLRDAHRIGKPHYFFTMISEAFSNKPVQDYVDRLSDTFPNSTILLSGYQIAAQKVQESSNVKILHSLNQTISFIESIKV